MRMRRSIGVVVGCVVLALCQSAWCWGKKADAIEKPDSTTGQETRMEDKSFDWPESGEITTSTNGSNAGEFIRREHLRFKTADFETQFLRLLAARQRVREDLLVINRLLREKENEIERFSSDLEKEYSIKPDGNYQYDNELMTIYELVRKQDAPEDETGSKSINSEEDINNLFNRREYVHIKDKEKQSRFLRLAAAKQLSSREFSVLQLLQREKELELSSVRKSLTDKYSISNDRNYEYDSRNRILYELVPVPATQSDISTQTNEQK